MTLPAETIEQLEEILFSDEITEETLDYFGLHGLISASVVGPQKIKSDRIIEIIFGNDKPSMKEGDHAFLKNVINLISEDIKEQLLDEDEILLPYMEEHQVDENGHYDACLESWCTGFMEGFFDNEKAWFTKGEDVAAELLLPIMALSGLFENDEFEEIRRNQKLMSQFEEILPEQLVDIFLYYHSE